jgi:hypothetical protein
MADILENAESDLTPRMRNLINGLWSEWKLVEQEIELERISAADADCTRIRKIPGIGPVVATAIVAAIGNGAAFRKGREFAVWLISGQISNLARMFLTTSRQFTEHRE